MDTNATSSQGTSRAGGGFLRSVIGLVLVITGLVSYLFLLDHHWIRTWAIPNIALMLVGTWFAWTAVQRRPRWAGITASVLTTPLTLFFIAIMYVIQPPAAEGLKSTALSLASLPTPLQDHQGNSVSLAGYAGKGPVLLVFYRGHW
jgi:hypothetical protein